MPAVVVDVDGTLVDDDGSVNQRVVDYINKHYKEAIVMTNRGEGRRSATEKLLKDIGIDKRMLVMNSTKPKMPSDAWKKKMVKFLKSKGHHIVEFIDNKPENREAIKSIGGIKVTDPATL